MVKIRKELCTQSENKIKKRRVSVVDDHPIVREGLEQLISREADLDVCCSAENAAEALQDIEKCSPDIAIIDLNLEESSGITTPPTTLQCIMILIQPFGKSIVNIEIAA